MANQKNQKEAAASDIKLEVRVYPIAEPKNNTLAFAAVTVNDIVALHGLRVMDSSKGQFVAMPSMKDKDGQYRDIFHPVTADFRKQLNTAVMEAYAEAIEKGTQEKASVRDEIKAGEKEAKAKPAEAKEKAAKKTEPDR